MAPCQAPVMAIRPKNLPRDPVQRAKARRWNAPKAETITPQPGRAKGGKARTGRLTPEQREEIARVAAAAKCGRRVGWTSIGFSPGSIPETALDFMHDLASRLAGRVQITIDGMKAYVWAVSMAFGEGPSVETDYAQLHNEGTVDGAGRYSPPKCNGVTIEPVFGNPLHAIEEMMALLDAPRARGGRVN